MPPRIEAVGFDVGETIVDEAREYGRWADWLGVPRHTFFAVLGAVIARGQDHREVFQVLRPGFDLVGERRRRAAAGQPDSLREEDLYPDARPCLAALRQQGRWVGLAGNQPAGAEAALRALDLPLDLIATSDGWGVEKPSTAFFDRVVAAAGCPAERVLYVGDRLDNDIRPAQAAGLATALIRRGPWGHILRDDPVSTRCRFQISSLSDLPALLCSQNG